MFKFITLLLLVTFAFAQEKEDVALQKQQLLEKKSELQKLSDAFDSENIYRKIYSNYQTYNQLQSQLQQLQSQIESVPAGSIEHSKLLEQEELINRQLVLLQSYAKNPFDSVMQPKPIDDTLEVSSPFAIISGITYLRQLQDEKESYAKQFETLRNLIEKLNKKYSLTLKLSEYESKYTQEAKELEKEIATYSQLLRTYGITRDVYLKEVEEKSIHIKNDIETEVVRLLILVAILASLFAIVALLKYAMKKYISDNERFYLANKSINFIFVTLALLIVAFRYIENVSYIVTVLGFASAGIAIAMKDWFMSILGWMVIVFGGSIHVGDRVKVKKDGLVYVGDVIDLSLFKMTLHEDVTLVTYMENRRGGRIIFVPNHYIFTSLIANYSHSGMKTVWDGIDFTITFDSNVKKSTQIAKEIAKKYAKGYTNITRTQLNKLRSKYSLKNTNVEPRVFSFIEDNGVRISVWYMTNAYATLPLRSNISAEIVDTVQKEDDITLAYPTQSIYMDKDVRKPADTIEMHDKGGVIV